jgi:hypothetical protein
MRDSCYASWAEGYEAVRVLDELRLRHVPIDRRHFTEYIAAMRLLVMPEGDTPAWWADAYIEATTGQAAARRVVVV